MREVAGDGVAVAPLFLTLGGLLLASLLADLVGRRTRVPRVTLLLALGILAGPMALDLLPPPSVRWYPVVAETALLMVAFLLGGELTLPALRRHGRTLFRVSLAVVVVTVAVVAVGLRLLGWPLELALLLGAISASTAPAATADVVREVRAAGPFTKTLLGLVAVDDAWGILVFSFALALVLGLEAPNGALDVLRDGAVDVFGAAAVGVAVGVPVALLSGRIRAGEPSQAEALGAVLLCGGLAAWFQVSFLMAGMVMGVVVANLARHHRRPFREIEGIEWPFMALFFLMSGAALEVRGLETTLPLLAAYVVLRVAGRLAGGWLGTRWSGDPGLDGSWIGLAMLPQAGVAIGLALVAAARLPGQAEAVLAATVAATVVFELGGPILARRTLEAAGEARAQLDANQDPEARDGPSYEPPRAR